MRGLSGTILYILTAPIRLFGRSRLFRWTLGAVVIVGVAFAGAQWALNRYLPIDGGASKAVANLPALPPLAAVNRPSQVIAPVAISIAAIGRSLEASTPKEFSGDSNNPVSGLLSQAQIALTVARGPMAAAGKPDGLTVTTPINGTLQVNAQIASQIGNISGALSGLLGGALGDQVKSISQALNQKAELRGNVVVRARPAFAANWRIDPNISAQVSLADTAVAIAGTKINLAAEAKPLIDQTVNKQVAELQERIRNDPTIERVAREQWAQLCRTLPLGGGDTGLPPLFLEMRPVRASAAQPQIDASNLTLTIGVQAATRIVATATKPSCPFPAALDLVPSLERGKLNVVMPVDMPFKTLNPLLEAQLKGRVFPEDKSGPVEVEVRQASLAAAGDRLLISLRVNAKERKSWFGFGADADVNIWGKPVLDPKTQMLRLTDLTLAVETQAAFGLLGPAARAAVPYLQDALAEYAKIDLRPFIADAKAKIDTTLTDFTKSTGAVKVDAAVRELRVAGIAFDSTTLRVIVEADGTARVAVTELPRL